MRLDEMNKIKDQIERRSSKNKPQKNDQYFDRFLGAKI